jgi:hypothetical protein
MRRVLASLLIVTALLFSAAAPTLALLDGECGCGEGPCDPAVMACADMAQCASGQCARLVPGLPPATSDAHSPAVDWADTGPAPGLAGRATGPHLRPPNA